MSWKRSFSLPVIVLLLLAGMFGTVPARMIAAAGIESQNPSRTWPAHLDGTTRFELPGDILVWQHQQIEDYFLKRIQESASVRDQVWKPDFSSIPAYAASLRAHRKRLVEMLGLLIVQPQDLKPSRLVLAEGKVRVEEVRVSIDHGFDVRALVFFPESAVPAPAVIAIPPENMTRESFAGIAAGENPQDWLLSLLSRGVAVAVPVTVERSLDHELSQLSGRARMTRRQLLHRVGFVVGRTMLGLEVQ